MNRLLLLPESRNSINKKASSTNLAAVHSVAQHGGRKDTVSDRFTKACVQSAGESPAYRSFLAMTALSTVAIVSQARVLSNLA